MPENRRSPEARELLGVAYQKDRQPAAAKSAYEDYLRRYPNGEGSEGVRQRLLAMETADASTVRTLRAPTIGPAAIDGIVLNLGRRAKPRAVDVLECFGKSLDVLHQQRHAQRHARSDACAQFEFH